MEVISKVPGLDELFNRVHPDLAVPLPMANIAQFVIPEALPEPPPAISSIPTRNGNNAIFWIVVFGGVTLLYIFRNEISDFIFSKPDSNKNPKE